MKNPVMAVDVNSAAILSRFHQMLRVPGAGDMYRIVFPKGTPRTLMTLKKGELAGLKTAVSLEDGGKISGLVGLQPVEDVDPSLLPAILNLGFYGAVAEQLKQIAGMASAIRQHQVEKDQARFERISETIIDCAEFIPLMVDDGSLRDIHLARVIKAGDECLELLIYLRNDLRSTVSEVDWLKYNACDFWSRYELKKKTVSHPIFAVLERFVAARMCAILITGDYSADSIRCHSSPVRRQIGYIREIIQALMNELNFITRRQENSINNYGANGDEVEGMRRWLTQHREFVSEVECTLHAQLEGLLAGFDMLRSLSDQEKIELCLVDGKLWVDAPLPDSRESGLIVQNVPHALAD